MLHKKDYNTTAILRIEERRFMKVVSDFVACML